MKKRIHIAIIVLLTVFSCQKNEHFKLVQQQDLMGKFEIGIPENWHIEKEISDKRSFIIASDTTKSIDKTLVIDISWNYWEIYLNEHFQRSLDSINEIAGFKTSHQKIYSFNEYNIYEYQANGRDTLNNLTIRARNFFFQKNGFDGSLSLNVRVNNRNFNKQDSLLIRKILKTIKRQ